MRIFCTAKDSHIFFNKKLQRIYDICSQKFNETLTNDVVNFEQLGPEVKLGTGSVPQFVTK